MLKYYRVLGFLFAIAALLSACAVKAAKEPPIESTPTQTLPAPRHSLSTAEPSATPPPTAILTTPAQTTGCTETAGRWREDLLSTEDSAYELPFRIYLPPCFDAQTDKRYPVLVLLHGAGDEGNMDFWVRMGIRSAADRKIAQGTRPFLIVLPSFEFYGGTEQTLIESLSRQLLEDISARYRAEESREYRALGGVSYGANLAAKMMIIYPEAFSKFGLHSPDLSLEELNQFIEAISETSPADLPSLWLDVGDQDPNSDSAIQLDRSLNEALIQHRWLLGEGSHSLDYWGSNLERYLNFYIEDW